MEYPALVEHATEPPGKCAVTGDIDGPFIDTGKDIVDPSNMGLRYRIYLHLPYVQQLARQHGEMVDGDEVAALKDELAETTGELEALQLAFDALHGVKAPA